LSLIVTGSVSGELAIWDYEFSRLLDYLLGHTSEVTSIHFLFPYALMLTTSLDSVVCIW
jgi:WD40 repeat protein